MLFTKREEGRQGGREGERERSAWTKVTGIIRQNIVVEIQVPQGGPIFSGIHLAWQQTGNIYKALSSGLQQALTVMYTKSVIQKINNKLISLVLINYSYIRPKTH